MPHSVLTDSRRYQLTSGSSTPTVFSRPHTLFALFLSICLLSFTTFYLRIDTKYTSFQHGIIASCCFFLIYSAFQLRDSVFQRPHPVMWRVIKGLSLLYLLLLIFLLYQPIDWSRQFMTFFDSSTGIPLEERSYAVDCRVYTPGHPDGPFANVASAVKDEFVMAHIIGWYVKMIMIRDFWLANLLSVLFEFAEFTFQHILENFKECWFDHWILDVLCCNLLGIWLGSITCEYLSFPQQCWFDGKESTVKPKIESKFSKLKKDLGIFSFAKFKWDFWKSPARFFTVSLVIFVALVVEINGFFLKTILWVPVMSPIVTLRLLMWFLWAMVALAEIYDFITKESGFNRRLGDQAWIVIAMAVVETLFIFKHGSYLWADKYTHPLRIGSWFVVWFVLFIVAGISWIKGSKREVEKKVVQEREIVERGKQDEQKIVEKPQSRSYSSEIDVAFRPRKEIYRTPPRFRS
ncbi:hypothetical protein RCL1_007936 [Eukaryota sp. TZLM3-RCL]